MAADNFDVKQAMFQVSDGVLGAAVLIVIGVLGGNWLDSKLHTGPLFLIVLSLLGGGLGLARLVQKALKLGDMSSPSATTAATSKSQNVSPETNKPSEPNQDGVRQRNPYEDYED